MANANPSVYKLPGVIYSHQETQRRVGEQFIIEHGLCYILSGNLIVADGGVRKVFQAGDQLFYRKNFLARFIKQPAQDTSFRSITVIFDREMLTSFSKQYEVQYEQPYLSRNAVLHLDRSLLLENFFTALIPYFDTSLPEQLVQLKKQEALMLLLQASPVLKNVLFDFTIPGKIDLEAFMQQNFRFNVELKQLAFLTGRSLATFKRDFEKTFHTSPSRWLQQRRLQEAHYMIIEEKKRPSDVFHEVGFETFSHFSYSFKQHYGINPSRIQ